MGDHHLNVYVAIDRRGARWQDDPAGGRRRGAALFADIAGFTPFTNELVRLLGPRAGAEELTRHLNRVYDALIAEVRGHGGTVIDFSGDAILCWFDDDLPHLAGRGRTDRGIDRAITCGRRQIDAMAQVASLRLPDGREFSLSLKVGIAAGPARRLAVGDPDDRLSDVLAGSTVDRAALAERRAEPGEVVVELGDDPAAGPGAVLVIDELPDPAPPAPWPVPPTVDAEATIAWIDRRLRGDIATSTELRSTVALFVRFGGLDFDADPDADRKLDAYVRWVQGVLAHHDGLLVQVTLGDKGGYLYLSFGAHRAYENLADRALAAALDLREPPAACGLDGAPSMGLAQGIMRTGAYGSPTRRTYGALGDATNLAARLMSNAAPGEILVANFVRDAAKQRLVFESQPPLTVKGQPEPVAVARLVGRPIGLAVQAFGDLVGRRSELAHLSAQLDTVLHGPAGTVVVEGEPGIGKSHLLDAARRSLATRGEVTWLTVETDDVARGSFGPFLPVVADLFFLELAHDDEGRRALFELGIDGLREGCLASGHEHGTETAEALAQDASFLGALVGVRWPDSPYEQHDPRSRHERSAQAIEWLLRAEALRRPTVLHVRDAHWLDDDSIALLHRLDETARTMPLALLVDRRPPNIDHDPLRSVADTAPLHVRLTPLDADGVADLAALALGGPISPELADQLAARTGGNPLFCQQLVLDLRDRGLLRVEQGVHHLDDLHDREVPLTLQATLASRLDRLSTPTRVAAQCAAVLGETFAPATLADLLLAEAGLDAAAGTLIDDGTTAGLWHRLEDGRVQFRHALVRDTAYAMQLEEHLAVRHHRAAHTLRRRSATDARPHTDLAHHERRAGRHWRAAAEARAAARAAASRHVYRDARTALTEARQDAARAGAAARCLARLDDDLAGASFALGEYETTAQHLYAALAADADDSRRRLRRNVHRGEALERWGRYDDADAAYEDALADLALAPDLSIASRIYGGLAMVRARLGELDDALELGQLAVDFAGERPSRVADAHLKLCVIRWRRGELDDAVAHGSTARAVLEPSADLGRLAAVQNNLGLVYAARGDLELAIAHYRAAVDAFTACGNEHGLACALDNLAQSLMQAGHEDEAMLHLEHAVRILARIGMGSNEVFTAMWQAGSW